MTLWSNPFPNPSPLRPRNPRWTNVINAPYAARLRRRGLTWRAIGERIAREDGRFPSYGALAVSKAVNRWHAGLMDDYF